MSEAILFKISDYVKSEEALLRLFLAFEEVHKEELSAALRKARQDALEESASIAKHTQAPDGKPWEWPVAISDAILAAKDKPPKAC